MYKVMWLVYLYDKMFYIYKHSVLHRKSRICKYSYTVENSLAFRFSCFICNTRIVENYPIFCQKSINRRLFSVAYKTVISQNTNVVFWLLSAFALDLSDMSLTYAYII